MRKLEFDFDIPEKEIEKRKQAVRDVWDYRRVDHIPVMLSISSNPFGYTTREELTDKEKQLDIRLSSLKRTLELVPDDYIPSLFINTGCVGVESALGMQVHWGETEDQTPGVVTPLLKNIEDVYSLKPINPERDGMIPTFLEMARYFTGQTGHKLPVSCMDMNGPSAIAMNILGSENFFLGMYTNPEEIHHLLDFTTGCILSVTEACIRAAGGIGNITSTDFVAEWFPEGMKGHVSDDVSAMIKPEFFKEFSIPANSRVFAQYGPGTLHNCGPNPCASLYLEHTPRIHGADLNFQYSKADLPSFRRPFSRKGVIYLGMGYSSFEGTVADFRYIIDSLAPDVIAIPSVVIDERMVDAGLCDVGRLYDALRAMATEYADMIWG